jgi:hypothetical protein
MNDIYFCGRIRGWEGLLLATVTPSLLTSVDPAASPESITAMFFSQLAARCPWTPTSSCVASWHGQRFSLDSQSRSPPSWCVFMWATREQLDKRALSNLLPRRPTWTLPKAFVSRVGASEQQSSALTRTWNLPMEWNAVLNDDASRDALSLDSEPHRVLCYRNILFESGAARSPSECARKVQMI